MIYPRIPVAQSIISLCLSKDIDHVVISPGSRNAPLTIGFSEHDKIKAFSIVDERCAGFVALGMIYIYTQKRYKEEAYKEKEYK